MHGKEIIYASICINDHVLSCEFSMLSLISTFISYKRSLSTRESIYTRKRAWKLIFLVRLLFHRVTLFFDLSITPIPSSLIHCISSSIYFSPSLHSLIPLCIYLSLCPSISLFINLSLYLSIHQSMYSYIFLPPFTHPYKIKT